MTSDVTSGVTSDVTSDVTQDVTSDVTSDVTPDVTPDVTQGVTSDVTQEVSPPQLWRRWILLPDYRFCSSPDGQNRWSGTKYPTVPDGACTVPATVPINAGL